MPRRSKRARTEAFHDDFAEEDAGDSTREKKKSKKEARDEELAEFAKRKLGIHEFKDSLYEPVSSRRGKNQLTTVTPRIKFKRLGGSVATKGKKKPFFGSNPKAQEAMIMKGIIVDRHIGLLMTKQIPGENIREHYCQMSPEQVAKYQKRIIDHMSFCYPEEDIKSFSIHAMKYFCYMLRKGYRPVASQKRVKCTAKSGKEVSTPLDQIWVKKFRKTGKEGLVLIEFKFQHRPDMDHYDRDVVGYDTTNGFSRRKSGALTDYDLHQMQLAIAHCLYMHTFQVPIDSHGDAIGISSNVVVVRENGGCSMMKLNPQHYRAAKRLFPVPVRDLPRFDEPDPGVYKEKEKQKPQEPDKPQEEEVSDKDDDPDYNMDEID